MMDVQCKELIVSNLKVIGKGKSGSPLRVVTEVYEKNGDLIAQFDPQGGYAVEEMEDFAKFYAETGKGIDEWKKG